MMQEALLRKLIEKNYFQVGTEIEAIGKGVGMSALPVKTQHTYVVCGIYEKKVSKTLLIDGISNSDGSAIRIGVGNILNIDGMTPERFAENYMLDLNGSEIKPSGRRRGRRPKGWTPEDDEDYFE